MLVTAIEGVVENGKIRLQEDVPLPENAKVFVIVADVLSSAAREKVYLRSPRLAHPEDAKRFQKEVLELPDNGKI